MLALSGGNTHHLGVEKLQPPDDREASSEMDYVPSRFEIARQVLNLRIRIGISTPAIEQDMARLRQRVDQLVEDERNLQKLEQYLGSAVVKKS